MAANSTKPGAPASVSAVAKLYFATAGRFDINEVIDQFEASQYRLHELIRIGFKIADDLHEELKLPRLDPRLFPPPPSPSEALAELKQEVRLPRPG